MSLEQWRRDWGGQLTVGLAAYVLAYVLWAVLDGGPPGRARFLHTLWYIPLAPSAVLLCWRASRADGVYSGERQAWRYFGVHYLLSFIGDMLFFFPRAVADRTGSLALVDAPYLASYVALAAGLLSLPRLYDSRAERIQYWLDAAATLIGGGMAFWHLAFRFVVAPPSELARAVVAESYLPADLVNLMGLAIVLPRRSDPYTRNAMHLMGLSLTSVLAAHVLASQPGRRGADFVPVAEWAVLAFSYFFQVMSAHAFRRSVLRRSAARASGEGGPTRLPEEGIHPLPHVFVLVGYGVLALVALERHTPELLGLVIGALGLTSVVILRQIVAARQNARLLAERAERESEARFRSLVQNASDVITILRGQGKLGFLSPSVERVLGYSASELAGRPLAEILHPEDGGQARLFLERIAREPGTATTEWRVQRSDGAWRTLEVDGTDCTGDPSLGGLVLTLRDITPRKQAEREREALIAELESKNRELERFTYTVSHDLKSPLITVRGFLGHVRKDATAGNLERMGSDLTRIEAAVEAMQRLLNELLELSRIGRIMNPPERIPFATLAREAVSLVGGRIAEGRIEVVVAEGLPEVFGDHARLVQVVQNLVDNAAKFMGSQAKPRIEIGATVRDGLRVLFVRDNGVGVDPRFHEKVFGLFEQLEPQSEGTGVGLALVKRIVEVHGGSVWVESEGRGKGSTFLFSLAEPGVSPRSGPSADRSGSRIGP